MVRYALTGVFVWLAVSLPLTATAQSANPFEADPAAIQAGRQMFAARCTACHGADAKGANGPDLTEIWQANDDDGRVFAIVRNGVEGSAMPPSQAPDNELWAMIAYLRSISTVPPFVTDGDPARGREIFVENCQRCHRVDGQGGALGPDLSRIAQVRSRDALVESIRDPGASVAEGYRPVRLLTRSGERIVGAVKAEDAFSIQILDTNQRLQGYRKTDLAAIDRDEDSLMPKFGRVKLGERELEDLLAYLGTLRADRADIGGNRR